MKREFLIEDLAVDPKVKEVLKKSKIKDISYFENINIRKIKKLNNLGEKYVQQLENELYSLGIDLNYDEEIINKCKKWRKNQTWNKLLNKDNIQIRKFAKEYNTNQYDKDKEERD